MGWEAAMASPHAVAITLSAADCETLERCTRRRKTAQGLAMRARIVLVCAEAGMTNGAVAKALGVSRPTVATGAGGLPSVDLMDCWISPRPGAPRRITPGGRADDAYHGQTHRASWVWMCSGGLSTTDCQRRCNTGPEISGPICKNAI